MSSLAYYNEVDPFAAQWLRNLIEAGHIAPGVVDERSIVEVEPEDIDSFEQCHFFAGIGVWSYALRQVGWSDDRQVWTGSCPCQPFSDAGKGKGIEDERHLWPHFFRLINERRPPVIFGEQVASKAGLGWFDAVSTDLEGANYAVGAADLCAAGVGAPHLRQRLYFVADSERSRPQGHGTERGLGEGFREIKVGRIGCDVGLADSTSEGRARRRSSETGGGQKQSRRLRSTSDVGDAGREGGRRDAGTVPCTQEEGSSGRQEAGCEPDESVSASAVVGVGDSDGEREDSIGDTQQGKESQPEGDGTGPVNGFWNPADWVLCRDPKGPRWRPVEPGTFPLAHGAASRVGRLRAYGNAIVAPLAAEFIIAYNDITMDISK